MNELTLTPDLDERASQTSYSALVKHRECPQAWLYRYGYRLEEDREGTSAYALLGSWWSVLRAAEAISRSRERWNQPVPLMPETLEADRGGSWTFDTETLTTEDVLSAAERAWNGFSAETREEFSGALGEPLNDRLRAMFRKWDAANAERFDREKPIGVEVYVERELPGTAVDGQPPIKVIGYIDEIYLDVGRAMIVIRDNKTLKSLSNSTSALDDLMDSQLQLYTWIATPTLQAAGFDPARAVGYDRVRSTAPKTPQLTLAGGLSKAVTDYDLETYRRWAVEDTSAEAIQAFIGTEEYEKLTPEQQAEVEGLEPGRLYGKIGEFGKTGPKAGQPKFGIYEIDEKTIEALDTPSEQAKWHSRTLRPVQRGVVTTHLQAAIDSAKDIRASVARAKTKGAAPRNLTRRGCQWCPFAGICRAQMVGGASGEYDLESLGLRIRPERPVAG